MRRQGPKIKRDTLIRMVTAIAAGDIEQDGVPIMQAALGRADRFHSDTGADIAGRAIQRAGAQTVFTEAGNAQHILGHGLVKARDAHGAAIKHICADFTAKPRLADTVTQQHRSDFFDDQLVQLTGAAHTGQLIFALDRTQAG